MKSHDANVSLVRGGGGVFDITIGDKLVFSKKNTGRFPTDEEVAAMVAG